jgi:hypothetical protein
MFEITTTVELSDDLIAGVLCAALEGGSNYWYHIVGRGDIGLHPDPAFEKSWGRYAHVVPFREGGYLEFSANADDDNETVNGRTRFTLDRAAIERGLDLMAKMNPPFHFNQIVDENYDAGTGDVFLQMCLFGTLVYG